MTTLSFHLELDDHLALAYQNAEKKQRLDIQKQVNQLVEYLLKEQTRARLYALVDEMHAEATANGLTEQKIDEILAEHE